MALIDALPDMKRQLKFFPAQESINKKLTPEQLHHFNEKGYIFPLDVFTPDRVGALHMIAQAIFDCDVMIEQARITTEGERAVDSFYVVDQKNQKPLTEHRREELAEAIRGACNHALTTLDL